MYSDIKCHWRVCQIVVPILRSAFNLLLNQSSMICCWASFYIFSTYKRSFGGSSGVLFVMFDDDIGVYHDNVDNNVIDDDVNRSWVCSCKDYDISRNTISTHIGLPLPHTTYHQYTDALILIKPVKLGLNCPHSFKLKFWMPFLLLQWLKFV